MLCEGIMRYYDISVPITADMPVFAGDPPVEITRYSSIEKGDLANVSRLVMGAHTGTHIDAPLHFFRSGRAVDEIPLDNLIGPATVVEVPEAQEISREVVVRAELTGKQRILFKTGNSWLWDKKTFQKDFVSLSSQAAEYLVGAGVKLVGIDYFSVERFGAPEPLAHRALLGAGVVVLEGINLSAVRPGHYELICLPLCIRDCDGAPCRAVLVER